MFLRHQDTFSKCSYVHNGSSFLIVQNNVKNSIFLSFSFFLFICLSFSLTFFSYLSFLFLGDGGSLQLTLFAFLTQLSREGRDWVELLIFLELFSLERVLFSRIGNIAWKKRGRGGERERKREKERERERDWGGVGRKRKTCDDIYLLLFLFFL